MIVFNKESHTYFNPDTKRPYISVSRLLSLYKEPFDKDFLKASPLTEKLKQLLDFATRHQKRSFQSAPLDPFARKKKTGKTTRRRCGCRPE